MVLGYQREELEVEKPGHNRSEDFRSAHFVIDTFSCDFDSDSKATHFFARPVKRLRLSGAANGVASE